MNGPTKDEVAAMVADLNSGGYNEHDIFIAADMLEALSAQLAAVISQRDKALNGWSQSQDKQIDALERLEAVVAQLAASEAARVSAEARVGELEAALKCILDAAEASDYDACHAIAFAALKGAKP